MIPIRRTPAGATLLHAAAQEGQLEAKLTQMFPTLLNQATCSLCFNSWFPRHILKPRFDSFLFASCCCVVVVVVVVVVFCVLSQTHTATLTDENRTANHRRWWPSCVTCGR